MRAENYRRKTKTSTSRNATETRTSLPIFCIGTGAPLAKLAERIAPAFLTVTPNCPSGLPVQFNKVTAIPVGESKREASTIGWLSSTVLAIPAIEIGATTAWRAAASQPWGNCLFCDLAELK